MNQLETKKELTAKDFSHLLGMEGFSDKMLTQHFQLYEAYVKNSNLLLAKFEEYVKKGDFSDPAFGEFKRRFGWEFNSVKLHELYFENLGGEKSPVTEPVQTTLAEHFGSFDKWKDEFVATASARGIGWAVLYQDPATDRLLNCWIDEHNNGHIAGANPVLVLDAFEHAFLTDYGIDRKKYITNFFKNIDWTVVGNRLI